MTDIDKLIRLNIETEGLLRVLADRDSADTRSLLADKFREYSAAMEALLAAEDRHEEAVVEEVKDQEAVGAEVVDETDAATEAIESGDAAGEPDVDNEDLPDAFSVADRDRFRRELFNCDEDDMDDTMALLAHMPSYDEAVDYLTNDLLWDSRNPAVADFFAILKANMRP